MPPLVQTMLVASGAFRNRATVSGELERFGRIVGKGVQAAVDVGVAASIAAVRASITARGFCAEAAVVQIDQRLAVHLAATGSGTGRARRKRRSVLLPHRGRGTVGGSRPDDRTTERWRGSSQASRRHSLPASLAPSCSIAVDDLAHEGLGQHGVGFEFRDAALAGVEQGVLVQRPRPYCRARRSTSSA